jgi:predicted transcriptional regulator
MARPPSPLTARRREEAAALRRLGFGVRAIARRLGVTPPAVRKLLRGRGPNPAETSAQKN